MLNDTEKLPPSSNLLWPSNEDWKKIEAAKQAALQAMREAVMVKVSGGAVGWSYEQTLVYDLPFPMRCSNCASETPQIRHVKPDGSTSGYICLDCGFLNNL